MGRNKLSADDRNLKYNLQLLNTIKDYAIEKNEYNALKEILSIRSKSLRDLCLFAMFKSKNGLIDLRLSPKELSKIVNFSERKIYDLIKVIYIISNCTEISLENITSFVKQEATS